MNAFLRDADMKKGPETQGMVPSGGPPERFGSRIRGDYERWIRVVTERKIKPE